MAANRANLPRLSELCKTPNIHLRDLAQVSEISIDTVKSLERNPPNKVNTWANAWRPRIANWIPLFGHAFPDVLESQALARCPEQVRALLREDYAAWQSGALDSISRLAPSIIEARRKTFDDEIYHSQIGGDPHVAEHAAAHAARLFPVYDSRWLHYRAIEATSKVYRGATEAADALIAQALAQYDWANSQHARTPDPLTRSYAVLVRSWSNFNRGNWSIARDGFIQAARAGDIAGDEELRNTGRHMQARCELEEFVLRQAFDPQRVSRLPISHLARCLKQLEDAQAIVAPDSVEAAFGTWYLGVAISRLQDAEGGTELIEKSAIQLKNLSMGLAVIRRTQLSLIQNLLTASAWDTNLYRVAESQLYDILIQSTHDHSPYVDAQIALTLARTRLLRDPTPRIKSERELNLNLVLAALLVHPYSQHALWKIGQTMLHTQILPAFRPDERVSIALMMAERVRQREFPFSVLSNHERDGVLYEQAIERLCREVAG